MSMHREAVEKNKLFGEFDKLAGFEDVSDSDVTLLQAMVLDTAERIGPHLDRIRHTFAQYTEHNLQHLLNIADHIHGFLPRQELNGGEVVNVNAVELTYLWLAILLHDIGMFVSDANEKQTILDSAEYKDLLRHHRKRQEDAQKARDAGHTVMAAAIDDGLFAEFIRRRHAERVHAYIDRHLKGKLHFRGSDLSRDIGNLCESHNWGVRHSRDSRFPDKCVERLNKRDLIGKTPVNLSYLACCLRLGDILDFDRSRTPLSAFHEIHFTETVSVEEWNKHLSVKGIEVTEHRGSYVAECEMPADYVAVQHFLDWVDRELQDCTRLVGEFPGSMSERYPLNLSPVVDRTQIRMKDPRYVAGGFRFQLEYDQIMRLLMDKSLYPDETLFLRELLQNALDACRYQAARAQEAGMADKYIPRIQVWDGSTAPRDPDKPDEGPRIVFRDNGVGMSLDQVENFFMRIGKSFYRSAEFDAERERLLEKGIHLDACSQFGIGFLSCFLGGDRIEVETYQHGREPLKITIDGPSKYFVIERISLPSDVGIRFNSPADPADDCPPHHAGTKVTVHLRDGWRKESSKPESDLAWKTLDAVAVNQDFPIMVVGLKHEPREIAARRWDCMTPRFCGWISSSNFSEIELSPAVFSLSKLDESLRGRGAIWFLANDGTPVLRKGDLRLGADHSYPAVIQDPFIAALRDFCHNFAGVDAVTHTQLIKALEELQAKPQEFSIEANALASGWARKSSRFNQAFMVELSRGDMNWCIAVAQQLPGMRINDGVAWADHRAEIDALLVGDREKLAEIWMSEGVTESFSLDLTCRYALGLFGIESPGAFQSWDAARGNAQRHDWLPRGVSAVVDTYADLAPQPAASRLFVPYERSRDVRAAVTRAFVSHAKELWMGRQYSEDWANWYNAFVQSWDTSELTIALEETGLRELIHELATDSRITGGLGCLCSALGAMHSEFGGSLFVMGFESYLNPRHSIPREHIEEAAKRAKVPADQIDETVQSLNEHLGWDITKGLVPPQA